MQNAAVGVAIAAGVLALASAILVNTAQTPDLAKAAMAGFGGALVATVAALVFFAL